MSIEERVKVIVEQILIYSGVRTLPVSLKK